MSYLQGFTQNSGGSNTFVALVVGGAGSVWQWQQVTLQPDCGYIPTATTGQACNILGLPVDIGVLVAVTLTDGVYWFSYCCNLDEFGPSSSGSGSSGSSGSGGPSPCLPYYNECVFIQNANCPCNEEYVCGNYTLTVSGIGNGTCLDCAPFNGSWQLLLLYALEDDCGYWAAVTGSPACYTMAGIPTECGDFANWIMFYNRNGSGLPANSWIISARFSNLYFYMPAASFNCCGSNTFTLVSSDSEACTNSGATATITPAFNCCTSGSSGSLSSSDIFRNCVSCNQQDGVTQPDCTCACCPNGMQGEYDFTISGTGTLDGSYVICNQGDCTYTGCCAATGALASMYFAAGEMILTISLGSSMLIFTEAFACGNEGSGSSSSSSSSSGLPNEPNAACAGCNWPTNLNVAVSCPACSLYDGQTFTITYSALGSAWEGTGPLVPDDCLVGSCPTPDGVHVTLSCTSTLGEAVLEASLPDPCFSGTPVTSSFSNCEQMVFVVPVTGFFDPVVPGGCGTCANDFNMTITITP